MLVATANLGADRIGAEFFTASANGRAFLESLGPGGASVSLRGGLEGRTHLNATDGKVELLWMSCGLIDNAVWPAHFLWFRIALHELAESLGPRVDAFASNAP